MSTHRTMQMQVVTKELTLWLKLRTNPDTLQSPGCIFARMLRSDMTLGIPERKTMSRSLIHRVTASTMNAFALRGYTGSQSAP